MIKVFRYSKSKGQKQYRKSGEKTIYAGTIKDWQMINHSGKYRNNPRDYVYRADYSDFGRTYTRTVKSKKTGISWKTVVKEI